MIKYDKDTLDTMINNIGRDYKPFPRLIPIHNEYERTAEFYSSSGELITKVDMKENSNSEFKTICNKVGDLAKKKSKDLFVENIKAKSKITKEEIFEYTPHLSDGVYKHITLSELSNNKVKPVEMSTWINDVIKKAKFAHEMNYLAKMDIDKRNSKIFGVVYNYLETLAYNLRMVDDKNIEYYIMGVRFVKPLIPDPIVPYIGMDRTSRKVLLFLIEGFYYYENRMNQKLKDELNALIDDSNKRVEANKTCILNGHVIIPAGFFSNYITLNFDMEGRVKKVKLKEGCTPHDLKACIAVIFAKYKIEDSQRDVISEDFYNFIEREYL